MRYRWALSVCVAALPVWGAAALASAQEAASEAPSTQESAQETEAPFTLAWRGPAECPAAEEVRATTARLLEGATAAAEPVRVDASVEPADAGFRLVLAAGQAERTLRSSSCAELAEAAALIVAMMVDPEAALAADAPPTREAEPEPEISRAEQELAAKALATSLGRPAPGQSASVRPAARAAVHSSTDAEAEARHAAPDAGGAEARHAATADDAARGDDAERTSTPLHWLVAAGLGVEAGPLPGIGVGPALAIGLETGALRLEAHGRYLPASRALVDNHDTAAGEVSLLAAGLRGCLRAVEGALEAGPCVGAEAGGLSAAGSGVTSPGEASAPWVAASAGGWLGVEIAQWLALRAEVEVAVPFNRPAFVIDGIEGEVHRPAPVAGRAVLGAEVRIR